MKRCIKHSQDENAIKASRSNESEKKLRRTLESGHSYKQSVTFNNFEEYAAWWEEDTQYED